MTTAYPHVAARLFGRPHAIDPVALRAILEGPIARRVLAGGPINVKGAKAKKAERKAAPRALAMVEGRQVVVGEGAGQYILTNDGIAIVPVQGVLSKRFDWMAAACGFVTYQGLAATFDAMLADGQVRAILMDVDSHGGEADGMLDIADRILKARAEKPVWAVANGCALSAGYGIAASASRLFLPRLATVGSIGCLIVHVDQSEADALNGRVYTAIYSGAHKIDGWGHAPLSEGARNSAQAAVDHVRDEFAALVARQGRMDARAALATEAESFQDHEAVEKGLADDVGTFEDALAALGAQLAGASPFTPSMAAMAARKPGALTMNDKPANAAAEQTADVTTKPAAETAPTDKPAEPKAADPADNKDKPADPAAPPAAAAPGYTAEMASEVMELCVLAGADLTRARAFVEAKKSPADVRTELAAQKAAAADNAHTDAHQEKPAANGGWDAAVEAVNTAMGHGRK